MSKRWQQLWVNCNCVTMQDGDYTILKNCCIGVSAGKIDWIDQMQQVPNDLMQQAEQVYDADAALLTPALIDCHTHLVFAGNRAQEFSKRLNGVSYQEILQLGGGIYETVAKTREASAEVLFESSIKRLAVWLENGVASVEIKSGYGLDYATEKKCLKVIQRLKKVCPMHITATYLGAHCIPKEYHGNADDYVELVVSTIIPDLAAEGLIDMIDVYCEPIAFSAAQMERIFLAAREQNIPVKSHLAQFSDCGGTDVALRYRAQSVDHLEYLSERDIPGLHSSGTTAVLLPAAFYFLQEMQKPPVQALLQHDVPIAIATDFNPGSAPVLSLLLAMNMACVLFKMTPKQAWLGVTLHAAKALNLSHRKGQIAIGYDADFALFDCQHPDECIYYVGHQFHRQTVIAGEPTNGVTI